MEVEFNLVSFDKMDSMKSDEIKLMNLADQIVMSKAVKNTYVFLFSLCVLCASVFQKRQ